MWAQLAPNWLQIGPRWPPDAPAENRGMLFKCTYFFAGWGLVTASRGCRTEVFEETYVQSSGSYFGVFNPRDPVETRPRTRFTLGSTHLALNPNLKPTVPSSKHSPAPSSKNPPAPSS